MVDEERARTPNSPVAQQRRARQINGVKKQPSLLFEKSQFGHHHRPACMHFKHYLPPCTACRQLHGKPTTKDTQKLSSQMGKISCLRKSTCVVMW
jgi:hypothetical protein